MEDEAGSGTQPEASGAEDPVGKSLLSHFITHNALIGVWEGWDILHSYHHLIIGTLATSTYV